MRGDEEKNAECTIEDALRNQAKENKAFFQPTSPIGTDEDYRQMTNILTSAVDQPRKSIEETTLPTSTEQINAGIYS